MLQFSKYYIAVTACDLRNNSTVFEELEVSIVDLTVANAVFRKNTKDNTLSTLTFVMYRHPVT
jgi:hypothetical protein